jgi:hypothetical protein
VIYRESDKDNENYFREKSTKLENELKLAKNDELKLRYEMDQQVKVIKSDEFKLRLGLESSLKSLKSELHTLQTSAKNFQDLLRKNFPLTPRIELSHNHHLRTSKILI